jgi:putative membrane protein
MQDTGAVDTLMSHPLAAMLAYFSVGILMLIVCLACFEWVTKYNCWDEIRKGNVAVAMATGGKIFGLCNIFRFSIQAQDTIYESLLWASIGFLLLLVGYFMFEFLTPVFRIDEEIAKDNRAVGLIAMLLSVSLSYIIGAAVTYA